MLASAQIQHLSHQTRENVVAPGTYACSIHRSRGTTAARLEADALRRMVVFSPGGGLSAEALHRQLAINGFCTVTQVAPEWCLVHCHRWREEQDTHVRVQNLPPKALIWYDVVSLANPTTSVRPCLLDQPAPDDQTTLHVAKLARSPGVYVAHHLSWTGLPWKQPVRVALQSDEKAILFEMRDQVERMAMEVMCEGTQCYHLGNAFRPWWVRVEAWTSAGGGNAAPGACTRRSGPPSSDIRARL
jgi:hypothetical protein